MTTNTIAAFFSSSYLLRHILGGVDGGIVVVRSLITHKGGTTALIASPQLRSPAPTFHGYLNNASATALSNLHHRA